MRLIANTIGHPPRSIHASKISLQMGVCQVRTRKIVRSIINFELYQHQEFMIARGPNQGVFACSTSVRFKCSMKPPFCVLSNRFFPPQHTFSRPISPPSLYGESLLAKKSTPGKKIHFFFVKATTHFPQKTLLRRKKRPKHSARVPPFDPLTKIVRVFLNQSLAL